MILFNKVTKPFARKFNTLLNGQIVSYSPKVLKVAIGKDFVTVTKEEMKQIENTSNAYGEKFQLVLKAFFENAEYQIY